jgi:hypothetical protein
MALNNFKLGMAVIVRSFFCSEVLSDRRSGKKSFYIKRRVKFAPEDFYNGVIWRYLAFVWVGQTGI